MLHKWYILHKLLDMETNVLSSPSRAQDNINTQDEIRVLGAAPCSALEWPKDYVNPFSTAPFLKWGEVTKEIEKIGETYGLQSEGYRTLADMWKKFITNYFIKAMAKLQQPILAPIEQFVLSAARSDVADRERQLQ